MIKSHSQVIFLLPIYRNELSYTSNSFGDDLTSGSGCKPSDNVAIIIHGWLESCETVWVQEIISCECT